MVELEEWLRTECFQKPTPEAYDLAKAAAEWSKQHWLDKAVEIMNKNGNYNSAAHEIMELKK